jgi:hypothetical protein
VLLRLVLADGAAMGREAEALLPMLVEVRAWVGGSRGWCA